VTSGTEGAGNHTSQLITEYTTLYSWIEMPKQSIKQKTEKDALTYIR